MAVLHIRSSLVARDDFANMDDANATHLPMFVATTTPFAVLALVFYSARMYSRMVPTIHLYWDDYIITLGLVRYVHRHLIQ
jgi:hypothetical protein